MVNHIYLFFNSHCVKLLQPFHTLTELDSRIKLHCPDIYYVAITIIACLFFSDMKTHESLHGWDAHHGPVCCLQFSFDETLLFSLGSDCQVPQI